MDDHQSKVRRTVHAALELCPQCRQPFAVDDLQVVGRRGDLWVLALRCPDCDTQTLVAAVVDDEGVDGYSSWSQDWEDETTVSTEPVTLEDVVEIQRFLDTFDGDFRTLFNE